MVIVLLISLYTTRVVLNVLGVDDYGVYNVIAGFVAMFSFLNSSMAGATQRFYNYELGKNGISGAQKVYCASFYIHLLLGLVIIIVTEPIGIWYINNRMVLPEGTLSDALWIFHFSVATLFITITNTPYIAAILANERMDYFAVIESIKALCTLGAVLMLRYITDNRLFYYGLFILIVNITVFILYLSYAYKKFPEIRFGVKAPKELFKEMLSFSGWGIFGSISYMLRDQGVNLLLNAFFGIVVNAARGVANQVNGALQSFISNIVTPSRPQVIQSYAQDNTIRAWRLTFSVCKITCLLFFMLSLPICLEIDYILSVWLGNDVPQYTSIFVILLLATNVFGTYVFPISTIISATGKVKFFQILSSSSNFLTVPLAYLFIKVYGTPQAAYLALFITMITNVLAGLISAKRYANLSYINFFKTVFLPCIYVIVISAPICYIPTFIIETGFFRLIVECCLSLLTVSIISYFAALNEYELNLIRKIYHEISFKIKR